MYYAAAQGNVVATAFTGAVLMAASLVIFGMAAARTRPLPRLAGIGLGGRRPLFAVIGVALDNFIESIACAILIASTCVDRNGRPPHSEHSRSDQKSGYHTGRRTLAILHTPYPPNRHPSQHTVQPAADSRGHRAAIRSGP